MEATRLSLRVTEPEERQHRWLSLGGSVLCVIPSGTAMKPTLIIFVSKIHHVSQFQIMFGLKRLVSN